MDGNRVKVTPRNFPGYDSKAKKGENIMSFASLNKGGTMPNGVDTTGLEYEPLSNFIGKEIKVNGFYFSTKGKYGKSVAVLSEGHLINFPNWSVPYFEEIAASREMVADMFAGKCIIKNIESKDTGKGNPTTVFEFADAE